MSEADQAAPTSKAAPRTESGENSDSDESNNDAPQTSEKVLGKRRARTPLEGAEEPQEEESLSDADADWEPEYDADMEQTSAAFEGSAPKFARLASEPEDGSSVPRGSPQPGPSTTRGARGIPVRRRTPRTRAAGKEGSPASLDALPYETPHFICGWIPLEFPNQKACTESCTRHSDLRRHQRPHFALDWAYADKHKLLKEKAEAKVALDGCGERGQSYPCEVCGKVYSRPDAVNRHRQQPQGKRCNIIYRQRRAAEKRAKGSQDAENNTDTTGQGEEETEESPK